MTRDRRSDLGMQERSAIQRYPREAVKLLDAGDTWMRRDIDLDHGALNTFHQSGVITKCGRNDGDNDAYIWRATAGVLDWIEKHIETNCTTPCGQSTGIRTIEPGTYTCSNPECDCRMDRETAAEVIG